MLQPPSIPILSQQTTQQVARRALIGGLNVRPDRALQDLHGARSAPLTEQAAYLRQRSGRHRPLFHFHGAPTHASGLKRRWCVCRWVLLAVLVASLDWRRGRVDARRLLPLILGHRGSALWAGVLRVLDMGLGAAARRGPIALSRMELTRAGAHRDERSQNEVREATIHRSRVVAESGARDHDGEQPSWTIIALVCMEKRCFSATNQRVHHKSLGLLKAMTSSSAPDRLTGKRQRAAAQLATPQSRTLD